MTYQELSPQGEALLKEIIDLLANNEDNDEHWHKRFDALSFQKENLLRDTFRELRECGYIKTQWADNIPYYLAVTVDGQNYEANKKAAKRPRESSPGGNGELRSSPPSLAGWLA